MDQNIIHYINVNDIETSDAITIVDGITKYRFRFIRDSHKIIIISECLIKYYSEADKKEHSNCQVYITEFNIKDIDAIYIDPANMDPREVRYNTLEWEYIIHNHRPPHRLNVTIDEAKDIIGSTSSKIMCAQINKHIFRFENDPDFTLSKLFDMYNLEIGSQIAIETK